MPISVPLLSIVFIIFDMLAGIAIPLLLFLLLRRKCGCAWQPFVAGCAVMLVFALVLEQFAHRLILSSSSGAAIQANVWLMALYGGLMAGLFEESGRFLAFKTVLKKQMDRDSNALMYGAGHGGFEAFALLSAGMINNLVISIMINAGRSSELTAKLSGPQLAAMQAGMNALAAAPSSMFLVSLVERLAALIAQLALSVFVWFAAKRGGKFTLLYPLALLMHLVLDAAAVVLSRKGASIALIETVVWLIALGYAAAARILWKKLSTPAPAGAAAV